MLPSAPKLVAKNDCAQNDAIHLRVKTQGEIELARIKAALDAKMTVLETHLKAAIDAGKAQRSYPPSTRDHEQKLQHPQEYAGR